MSSLKVLIISILILINNFVYRLFMMIQNIFILYLKYTKNYITLINDSTYNSYYDRNKIVSYLIQNIFFIFCIF